MTDYEQPPEQYSVEVAMEVVQPWVTADQTAHIEVTLTNHSEEPRELAPVVDGPDFPANNVEGIVLFDTTGDTRAQPPECINTDGKADEPVGYSGAQIPPHEVGAGESVTRRIGLFDDQNVRGCLVTGIYPFEITHLVRPVGEAEDGGTKEAETYPWTFQLGLRGDDG